MGHFLPFDTPNNPKNQDFEKMKKTPGDMILHKNHMMYDSYDFLPFYCSPPLNNPKN